MSMLRHQFSNERWGALNHLPLLFYKSVWLIITQSSRQSIRIQNFSTIFESSARVPTNIFRSLVSYTCLESSISKKFKSLGPFSSPSLQVLKSVLLSEIQRASNYEQ